MAKEEGGKKEDSVYDEEGREKLVEEGEMSSEEAGFMKGYEKADKEKKKMSLTKAERQESIKKGSVWFKQIELVVPGFKQV